MKGKNKRWPTNILVALLVAVAASGIGWASSSKKKVEAATVKAENQSEAQYPTLAKVTLTEAVQTALQQEKGKALKAELEDENGFLVYEVEVAKADGNIVKVKVDAGTPKILSVKQEEAEHHEMKNGEHENHDDEHEEEHAE